MNFKILTLPDNQIEICLHRDRNEAGDEIVRITSLVASANGMEPMLEKTLAFPDGAFARSFIEDFSEKSAQTFLHRCLGEEGIVLAASCSA
ncbi:hypothetical protein [Dyadobacter sandarakinus]|uniref:Uncharacterized protein n=1 Tax=Dyadobacter sandarakinus TaxID=2747268 RepID=A0ABX7I3Z5_9BACT|nr:hypothetical protein [Dyadobacter sandarakinus]QRR00650.1 hypothetical protein HWI92_06875 [Dyadobacter sandarakinus]